MVYDFGVKLTTLSGGKVLRCKKRIADLRKQVVQKEKERK